MYKTFKFHNQFVISLKGSDSIVYKLENFQIPMKPLTSTTVSSESNIGIESILLTEMILNNYDTR